jgi:hypothetical protein
MSPSLTQLPKAIELRRFERLFARRPLVIESGAPREAQTSRAMFLSPEHRQIWTIPAKMVL